MFHENLLVINNITNLFSNKKKASEKLEPTP